MSGYPEPDCTPEDCDGSCNGKCDLHTPALVSGDVREYFARILDPQAWDDTMKKSTRNVAVIQWAVRKVQSLEGADRLIAAGVPAPAPAGGDGVSGNTPYDEPTTLFERLTFPSLRVAYEAGRDAAPAPVGGDERETLVAAIAAYDHADSEDAGLIDTILAWSARRSPAPQVATATVVRQAAEAYTRDGSATGGEVREWLHEYAAALRSPAGEPTPAEPIKCEHGETKWHRFYAGLDAYHNCQFFEMGTSTPRSPVGDKP